MTYYSNFIKCLIIGIDTTIYELCFTMHCTKCIDSALLAGRAANSEPRRSSMFHFRRDQLPADIIAEEPITLTPGESPARWTDDNHFHDHKITFDISFCGSWQVISLSSTWSVSVWRESPTVLKVLTHELTPTGGDI
jgi:hypothetical protein